MNTTDHKATSEDVTELQKLLKDRGDAKTKQWWERYMKQVIKFYGIKMADLRKIVDSWWSQSMQDKSLEKQKAVAFELLKCAISEEKMAGILIFQKLTDELDLSDLDTYFKRAFREGHLFDWNNTDWLCMKVLCKLTYRGEAFARHISGWTAEAEISLWLRRAGVVAFVQTACYGDREPNFPGFCDLMFNAAERNLQSQERFLQTGTGWMLRELAKSNEEKVVHFISSKIDLFTSEGLSYATEKLPNQSKKLKKCWQDAHKPTTVAKKRRTDKTVM